MTEPLRQSRPEWPKEAKPRPIHAVAARLTMEEYSALSEIAKRQERPITFLLRKLILGLIEKETVS